MKNTFSLVLKLFLVSFLFANNAFGTILHPFDPAKHYRIYPVPHKIVAMKGVARLYDSRNGAYIDITTVNIVAEDGIDDVTINRAKQILSEHGLNSKVSDRIEKGGSNILLGIANSGGVADKMADKMKLDKHLFRFPSYYDKHILCLTNDGWGRDKKGECLVAQLIVLGENTDAVFCGLASFEQMLDLGLEDCVTIYDYADVKHRGVIEGYYGVPYSAAVTKDLFRFMARYKLNTYMYGAKSDPYHSRYWSEPYPTSITAEQEKIGYLTQDMMKDIAETAKQCKVDFIWAIHPGKAFADPENKEIIPQIMRKFESMHSLGVRQFGVFVDDVGVPSDEKIINLCAENLTNLQNTIDVRWNTEGSSPADTVKPLQYVPQLYAYSWVDEEKGRAFFSSFRSVPNKICIYITGANVWSVPNFEDIRYVCDYLDLDLDQKMGWWWNYLCNDSDVTKLFIADAYTNFRDETHIYSTSSLPRYFMINTLIVNPMQQGELSKIGLFSTADYSWNTSAFNNYHSWEAAIPAVVGKDMAEDFKNIVPALRYYDFDEFEYLVSRYKQSVEKGKPAPGSLLRELRKVNASCIEIKKMKDSSNESDRLFYNDLRPWLLKLEAMTDEAIQLIEGKKPVQRDYENDPDFRFEILGGMGEHIKMAERTAEPSAKVLRPFIQWLREQNN